MVSPSITTSPGDALTAVQREPQTVTGGGPEGSFTKRDLLEFLIVGGATILLIPFAWLYKTLAGLDESVYQVSYIAFYLAWVINDPHFAVSYLLFYKNAKGRALGHEFSSPVQRGRYWIAGFIVPLALFFWGGWGLTTANANALGLMFQSMFFLVGWHYVKQGFGCYAVLSARRGVKIEPVVRKVILTHCFSGWLFAWLTGFYPGAGYDENGIAYTSVSFPEYDAQLLSGSRVLAGVAFVVLLVSGVGIIYLLGKKWWQQKEVPALAPLGGLLISVWLWIIFSDFDPLIAYFIPALHSIQYLYFVYLLKRNEARAHSGPPAFHRPWIRLLIVAAGSLALGAFLFHGLPYLFDSNLAPMEVAFKQGLLGALHTNPTYRAELESAPLVTALGFTPYLATITAAINIHHYFMDHVIWRRENPATKYLRG